MGRIFNVLVPVIVLSAYFQDGSGLCSSGNSFGTLTGTAGFSDGGANWSSGTVGNSGTGNGYGFINTGNRMANDDSVYSSGYTRGTGNSASSWSTGYYENPAAYGSSSATSNGFYNNFGNGGVSLRYFQGGGAYNGGSSFGYSQGGGAYNGGGSLGYSQGGGVYNGGSSLGYSQGGGAYNGGSSLGYSQGGGAYNGGGNWGYSQGGSAYNDGFNAQYGSNSVSGGSGGAIQYNSHPSRSFMHEVVSDIADTVVDAIEVGHSLMHRPYVKQNYVQYSRPANVRQVVRVPSRAVSVRRGYTYRGCRH